MPHFIRDRQQCFQTITRKRKPIVRLKGRYYVGPISVGLSAHARLSVCLSVVRDLFVAWVACIQLYRPPAWESGISFSHRLHKPTYNIDADFIEAPDFL